MTTGWVALVAGAVGAVATWLLDRRRRAYTDLATTPCAAVFAGRNEVKGRAWAANPLQSYRTKTPCVWWDYELEEERRHTRTVSSTDSKGHTTHRTETYEQWHSIDKRSNRLDRFEVVDRTGPVEVLNAGKVLPRQSRRAEFRDDSRRGGEDGVLGFIGKMFDNRTGKYRETEHVVAVGDSLFVVGEARLDQERSVPVLAATLVSTRSESSHTGRLGAAVAVGTILTSLALGYGTVSAIDPVDPGPVAWAVGVAVPAGLLFLGWLVTTYNRLHLLAQGIDRGWSLIDVQLRRRHDLVPALAEVVKAHAAYEARVLTATTAARWVPGGHDAEALAGEAEQQTQDLRAVLAHAEAHPELTADDAFLTLQRELADTEGRIAGTRSFYNDSLTLLRNQTRTFPASLVARFLDLDHHEHLRADGFERTVPSIDRAF